MPAALQGDMNCDGVTDMGDTTPFAMALVSPDDYAAQYPNCGIGLADMNRDTVIDGTDVQMFVDTLLNAD